MQESMEKLWIRYTALDHIWYFHRELVEDEMKKMLKVKRAQFHEETCFHKLDGSGGDCMYLIKRQLEKERKSK
jgi:hypothetical protein